VVSSPSLVSHIIDSHG